MQVKDFLAKLTSAGILGVFLLMNSFCTADSGDDLDPLALLALGSPGSGGNDGGGAASSTSGSITIGTLATVTGITSTTYSFSVTKAPDTPAQSVTVYFSSNNFISTLDTSAGTASITAGSGTQNVSIVVPNGLVTSTTPSAFFLGLIPSTSSTVVSSNQVMVFPTGSVVTAYTMNSAPLTGQTLNSSTTQRYYETDLVNGVNIVAAAYQVAGGLDVIGNVFSTAGGLTNVNSRGPNDFERLGLNVTASNKTWIQIRRNGSTAGTFTFFANDSSILSGSTATGGGSCFGGTGVFAARCADYSSGYTSPPTNSTQCIAIQGAGSVYSAGACTSTNRIARCHAVPLLNAGRIIVNFYTPESTGTAASVCGGDILTTP